MTLPGGTDLRIVDLSDLIQPLIVAYQSANTPVLEPGITPLPPK